ncbi:MAG: FtsX-like permease family protein [Bacteroidota bacterium]
MQNFEGRTLLTHFDSQDGRTTEVIGIIKDFNFHSLHEAIGPLVMLLTSPAYSYHMAIRLTPGNEMEKVKQIEQTWKKFVPSTAFEYTFMDQEFDAKFRTEQRLGQLFIVFTSLAIFIACLGLLGLATFTAEQRAKEIGIRKVMGASVSQMVILVSKDFAKLVTISFVIAVPITWYSVENLFLNKFAYRIDFDILLVLFRDSQPFSLRSLRSARRQ